MVRGFLLRLGRRGRGPWLGPSSLLGPRGDEMCVGRLCVSGVKLINGRRGPGLWVIRVGRLCVCALCRVLPERGRRGRGPWQRPPPPLNPGGEPSREKRFWRGRDMVKSRKGEERKGGKGEEKRVMG